MTEAVPNGPIRTGRGTCHERAFAVQAAGGADTMRLRPNLCTGTGQTARLARPGTANITQLSQRAIEHLATPVEKGCTGWTLRIRDASQAKFDLRG